MLAVYAWGAMAMMVGQDLLTNPIFGFVYVWIWVGLVPISLLLGQFWRATNPLRTLHRGLCALAAPIHGKVCATARRLGVWPAALALFAFSWLELVQPDRTTLAVLRVWALAWLVIMISARSSSARAGSARPIRSRPTRAPSPSSPPGAGSATSSGWSIRWPA